MWKLGLGIGGPEALTTVELNRRIESQVAECLRSFERPVRLVDRATFELAGDVGLAFEFSVKEITDDLQTWGRGKPGGRRLETMECRRCCSKARPKLELGIATERPASHEGWSSAANRTAVGLAAEH